MAYSTGKASIERGDVGCASNCTRSQKQDAWEETQELKNKTSQEPLGSRIILAAHRHDLTNAKPTGLANGSVSYSSAI